MLQRRQGGHPVAGSMQGESKASLTSAFDPWPAQPARSVQSNPVSSCNSYDGSDCSATEAAHGKPQDNINSADLAWLDTMTQPPVPWEMQRVTVMGQATTETSAPLVSDFQKAATLVASYCQGTNCSLEELNHYCQSVTINTERHRELMDLLKTANKTSSQVLDVQARTADHSAIAAEQRRQIYDRVQVVEHSLSTSTQMMLDAHSVSNARIAQLEIQIAKVSIDLEQTRDTVLSTLKSIKAAIDDLRLPKPRARPTIHSGRKRKRLSPPPETLQPIDSQRKVDSVQQSMLRSPPTSQDSSRPAFC